MGGRSRTESRGRGGLAPEVTEEMALAEALAETPPPSAPSAPPWGRAPRSPSREGMAERGREGGTTTCWGLGRRKGCPALLVESRRGRRVDGAVPGGPPGGGGSGRGVLRRGGGGGGGRRAARRSRRDVRGPGGTGAEPGGGAAEPGGGADAIGAAGGPRRWRGRTRETAEGCQGDAAAHSRGGREEQRDGEERSVLRARRKGFMA